MAWDPEIYAQYSSERSRPFFDLVGQIGADNPKQVIDLGCGTGELTAALLSRWPGACITGIDSSEQMLANSAAHEAAGVSFRHGRAEEFHATDVDVLVSNALLQWVGGHDELLRRWAAELNVGGWLAFQVPANFQAPSHTLMRELAESPRWSDQLASVLRHADAVFEPDEYLELMLGAGLTVSVWQTDYLHILVGQDPVLNWVSGTGLRPILAALDEAEAREFIERYAASLTEAYPVRPYGTLFSFTRTFGVGHKPPALDRPTGQGFEAVSEPGG